MNQQTLVRWIAQTQSNPVLAINIAKRLGLPWKEALAEDEPASPVQVQQVGQCLRKQSIVCCDDMCCLVSGACELIVTSFLVTSFVVTSFVVAAICVYGNRRARHAMPLPTNANPLYMPPNNTKHTSDSFW